MTQSAPDAAPPKVYLFGSFRLVPSERRLWRGDGRFSLPPRVFDTLVTLVERAGRLVDKKLLLATVWAGAYVEEANLSVNVSTLRKALGEEAGDGTYIETVRGRGYRFLAPVTAEATAPVAASAPPGSRPAPRAPGSDAATAGPTPAAAARRRSRLVDLGVALLAVLVAAAPIAMRVRDRVTAPPHIESLAILPFSSLAKADGGDVFGLGLADALITRLSGLPNLAVRPTRAIAGRAGTSELPAEVGRELGTDAVLTGLLQRAPGRVRATVQLVHTRSGATLWAETFDEAAGDVFALQDAISTRVAAALALELSEEERQALTRRYTTSPEAHELYLRGRYHWFRWTPEDWAKARGYFEQAVARDPQYALAWAGLAESWGVLSFVSPPAETANKAKQCALRALALDPGLAEAHLAIGPRLFFYDWDWQGAAAAYSRALALSPNNALAHDVRAIYLYAMGRTDEAVREARRALALDPQSSYLGWDLGEALLYAGRHRESAATLVRTLRADPAFYPARFTLAATHAAAGEQEAALDEYLRALRYAGASPEEEAQLRAARATGGTPAFWRRRLVQLAATAERRYVAAYEVAWTAAHAGDRDAAFAWLERAYRERGPEMIRLAVDPGLDSLRSDARFGDLLRRMRLAPLAAP